MKKGIGRWPMWIAEGGRVDILCVGVDNLACRDGFYAHVVETRE